MAYNVENFCEQFAWLAQAYHDVQTCQLNQITETSEEAEWAFNDSDRASEWLNGMQGLLAHIKEFKEWFRTVSLGDYNCLKARTLGQESPVLESVCARMRRRAFQPTVSALATDIELARRDMQGVPRFDEQYLESLQCFCKWYHRGMVDPACNKLITRLTELTDETTETEAPEVGSTSVETLRDRVLILMQREYEALLSILCAEAKRSLLGVTDVETATSRLQTFHPCVVYSVVSGDVGHLARSDWQMGDTVMKRGGPVLFPFLADPEEFKDADKQVAFPCSDFPSDPKTFRRTLKRWAIENFDHLERYNEKCEQELRLYQKIMACNSERNKWRMTILKSTILRSCKKMVTRLRSLFQASRDAGKSFTEEGLAAVCDDYGDLTVYHTFLEHHEEITKPDEKGGWEYYDVLIFDQFSEQQLVPLHRRLFPAQANQILAEYHDRHRNIRQMSDKEYVKKLVHAARTHRLL